MSKIKVIKGDLFSAPKGSILVHACNTMGVWGSGIAKQFHSRYPGAYTAYADYCEEFHDATLGTALLIPEKDFTIGCLFTSTNFGTFRDPPEEILAATRAAVKSLLKQNMLGLPIAMCKINAGLFAVPWEDTLKILEEFDTEMTVYEF